MATVKTIKPGGGGDYPDLATWEAWADDQVSADQWAECYTGGNLGTVIVASWAATPDASNYPRIYVADGERHDGTAGTGAYIENTAAASGATLLTNFTQFEAVRVKTNYSSAFYGISITDDLGSNNNGNNVRVFDTLSEVAAAWSGAFYAIYVNNTALAPASTAYVYNNVLYLTDAANSWGVYLSSEAVA